MATVSHTTKIDRRAVMTKAWQLMHTQYRFGDIPFRSIGRECLAWCIGEAWRLAKQAARLATVTVGELADRIATIRRAIALAQYSDSFGQGLAEERAARAELDRLLAAARSAGLTIAA
jgi:hypothetical protein